MKYLILTATLPLLLFAACKKKEKYVSMKAALQPKNSGYVSADLNGKPWQEEQIVRVTASESVGKFDIYVYIFKGEVWDASFFISNIDLNSQRSEIRPIGVYASTLGTQKLCYAFLGKVIGGDAGTNDYDVLEDSSHDNRIEIEEYDASTNEVSGRFHLTLYKTHRDTVPGYSDTLRFTNATFRLKISNN